MPDAMSVYITGIGVISGIGRNVEENRAALCAGRSGLGPVTLFPTRHEVPVSEVKYTDTDLKELLGIPVTRTVSRTALLGAMAAREAFQDAGIAGNRELRIGLISSTSVGGMDRTELFYPRFRQDDRSGRLREIAMHDCGASTGYIASLLGINGFITTISTACSSAANAIMLGARLIRQGRLDAVVAGGTDALCRFTLNGFASLMILDKAPCRPFDESRAGLNLGEGAGYVVLQSARGQARRPYGELAGYANANDAYHQTASSPEGEGPWLAMKTALERSGLQPAEIGYINVHGTGTPNNDLSEGKALERLFGSSVPPFSSTKAFTGHTLGAAGGIEAVFALLAIEQGLIFPNLNFRIPIRELNCRPETTIRKGREIRAVLSNSFGFGGNNTSLVFKKLER